MCVSDNVHSSVEHLCRSPHTRGTQLPRSSAPGEVLLTRIQRRDVVSNLLEYMEKQLKKAKTDQRHT